MILIILSSCKQQALNEFISIKYQRLNIIDIFYFNISNYFLGQKASGA